MNRKKPIKNRRKLKKNYFSFLPSVSVPVLMYAAIFVVTAIVGGLLFFAVMNGFEVDGPAIFGVLALIIIPTAILFAVFTAFEKMTDISWLRGVEWIGKQTLDLIDWVLAFIQTLHGVEPEETHSAITQTDSIEQETDNFSTAGVSFVETNELEISEPVFTDFLMEKKVANDFALTDDASVSSEALENHDEMPFFADIADDASVQTVNREEKGEEFISTPSESGVTLDVPVDPVFASDLDPVSEVDQALHETDAELAVEKPLVDGVDNEFHELEAGEVDREVTDEVGEDFASSFDLQEATETIENSNDAVLQSLTENKTVYGDVLENTLDIIEDIGIAANDPVTELTEEVQATEAMLPESVASESSMLSQAEQTAASIISAFSERFSSSFSTPEKPLYQLPSIELLEVHQQSVHAYTEEELEEMSRSVERVLQDYKISVEVVGAYPGPIITRFELSLAPGIKVSRVSTLAKDLARAMLVTSVRVVEIIEGTPYIGLEIPNQERELVSFREILSSDVFQTARSSLTLALGKDVSGETVVADLAKMPHLLVAGTTGSGKSVAINTMILSLLYKSTPEQVRMIMVDPKMLELSIYEGIPHLLTPVVTDMKEAQNALRWAVAEMERRYKLMSKVGVRNLAGFNQMIEDAAARGESLRDPLYQLVEPLAEGEHFPTLSTLPSIVIVIDELADMMMIVGKKVEELIARLAQKARAAGIHLILATQRPSVDVLTGLIKANVPTRLSFQVSSRIDSRTILDQGGAEALLGNGDMLFLPSGTSVPIRAHGAFVGDHEVHSVVDYLKSLGEANYLPEITREEPVEPQASSESAVDEVDALYDEAVGFVMETGKASISSVQRRFKVGYNRAARMIDQMEEERIVSEPEGNGSRRILNKDE